MPNKKIAKFPLGVREILSIRADERADVLADSDDIAKIVPRIPPEELLFTLRNASTEAQVEILSHARVSQFRYVLDLELWDRETVKPSRATYWLNVLGQCEPAVIDRFAKKLDVADLTALLGKLMTAELSNEDGHPETDPKTGLESFTLDGYHYFTADSHIVPIVKNLFAAIRNDDERKYFHLIEMLFTGFDAEDEEEALRLKNIRLAEHGFVSFEEAQSVYSPISPEIFQKLDARRPGAGSAFLVNGYDVPRYPVALDKSDSNLLLRVLDRFKGTNEADSLISQLAVLTNKVISADALDVGDPESFRRAAKKTAGYLTIGLQAMFGADEERMARAVDTHWLEHIFRVGWHRVYLMSKAASHLVTDSWPGGKKERLKILDTPLPEIIYAALRKRPKWIEFSAAGFHERSFETLKEVELAERCIKKADFLGRFLIEVIKMSPGEIAQDHPGLNHEDLKSHTVFLTGLINAALLKGFVFVPIDRKAVALGLKSIWAPGHMPRKVSPRLMEIAVLRAGEIMHMTPLEEAFLKEFIEDSAKLLEDEYGHLPDSETPDPRFLRGIWLV